MCIYFVNALCLVHSIHSIVIRQVKNEKPAPNLCNLRLKTGCIRKLFKLKQIRTANKLADQAQQLNALDKQEIEAPKKKHWWQPKGV